MRSRRAILALILAPLLWSGNYIAGRYLTGDIPPLLLNGLRWALAAPLLLTLAWAKGVRVPLCREWRRFLWLGLSGMAGFSALLYIGIALLSASLAGAISGMEPVGILLVGVAMNRERPSWRSWLGILVSACGVLLLTSVGIAASSINIVGALAVIGSVFLWGIYNALAQRYAIEPLAATAGAAAYAALPSLVLGLAALPRTPPIHLTAGALVAILYASWGASVGGYLLWTYGLRALGPVDAAPFNNLLPVFAILLGIGALGERLTLWQTVGAVIVIAGAWFAATRPAPQTSGA